MKAEHFDEYSKNGCSFYGKLVVVNYFADMEKDPRFGTFNAGLTYDYLEKAKALVKERQYKVVKELLHIPEYVCEIE